MNISYDEELKVFRIDTENTTYCMAVSDTEGFLTHVYYGDKLGEDDIRYLLRINEPPFVPSVNNRDRSSFLDSCPQEFPGHGVGDYRESAVKVRDEDGHTATMFFFKDYRILRGKKKLEGLPATFGSESECMTLEIDMEDKVRNLVCTLSYSAFDGIDAIIRSVKLLNLSDDTVYVEKLYSLSVDIDASDFDYQMLTLHGSWARERQMELRTIGYGRQEVSSSRGESSHQEHPFLGIVSNGTSQESGSVYGFNFVYSGNFVAQIEKNQFGMLRVSMGINTDDFCFEVKKNESFQAPEVVCVYSGEGLGKMSRTFHDLYRSHLIRSPYKDKPRPVLINNWEATYFDFDSDKLISIATEAKKNDIEMLVMDDGWFGHRNDDNSSLGDWFVNEDKLKDGLKHLVDEVNKVGLKFGIWVEPEMISPDSKLYEEHPDWAIAVQGRTPCKSRNQYVLDLSRKEIRDYVYDMISGVLRSANIEYVKWDMNRQLTDIGSSFLGKKNQGELMHRYVLGVYEMQERLVNDFPDLLLENCSGGGARFDPGMLYYSPQIWCSDDTDAIERLSIQEGTALVYPLSAMGAHVSDCPNHTVGRVTPFKTRGDVALSGTFGYELDITKISDEDRLQIKNQVATFHKYTDLVRNGDYFRIASYSENKLFDCQEIVSKDKSEALITYVQVLSTANAHSRRLRIPGLNMDSVYEIEGWDLKLTGRTLSNAGLLMPAINGDFKSLLIHLIKE